MTELYKSFRYRKYLKNPFIGTHTPRLVKKTAKTVEIALYQGPEKIRRKSIFDIGQGFENTAVGRRFQHTFWKGKDNWWLVTRCKITFRHPQKVSGKAYGLLYIKGKLQYEGVERRIHSAGIKMWRLMDKLKPNPEGVPVIRPKIDTLELVKEIKAQETVAEE